MSRSRRHAYVLLQRAAPFAPGLSFSSLSEKLHQKTTQLILDQMVILAEVFGHSPTRFRLDLGMLNTSGLVSLEHASARGDGWFAFPRPLQFRYN